MFLLGLDLTEGVTGSVHDPLSPGSLIGQQTVWEQFLVTVTQHTCSPAALFPCLCGEVAEPQLGFPGSPTGVLRFGQGTVRTSPKMKQQAYFLSPGRKLSNAGSLSRCENRAVYCCLWNCSQKTNKSPQLRAPGTVRANSTAARKRHGAAKHRVVLRISGPLRMDLSRLGQAALTHPSLCTHSLTCSRLTTPGCAIPYI